MNNGKSRRPSCDGLNRFLQMASWADQVIHHILIETSFTLNALWRWTGLGLKAQNHFQVPFQTHSSVKLALSRVTWPRDCNFYPAIDDKLRFVMNREIWFILVCLLELSVKQRHHSSVPKHIKLPTASTSFCDITHCEYEGSRYATLCYLTEYCLFVFYLKQVAFQFEC